MSLLLRKWDWRKRSPSPRPSPHPMGRGWPSGRVRGTLASHQLGGGAEMRPVLACSLTLACPANSLRAMSRLPFELLLALRYLRPKRTFVSVIPLISIIGVMLGVAVLIIVISVMSGFDREMREKILGFNAHVRVQEDAPMRDYEPMMRVISANKNVKG